MQNLERERRVALSRFWEAPSTPEEIRIRILDAAAAAVDTVQARRLHDLRQIQAAYTQAEIAGIDAAQASGALEESARHVREVAALLAKFQGKEYWTWNQHLVPADESFYSLWLIEQVAEGVERAQPEVSRWLKKPKKPSELLSRLFEAAAADTFTSDSLGEEPPAGISPYEAKLILFYSLPMELRRTLVGRLELRFDIRDICPGVELFRLNEEARKSLYFCSVITDGYFYGALRANVAALLSGMTSSLSQGVDCSSFVQWAYEQAGYSSVSFKSPISTRSMIAGDMPGIRDGIFAVERLDGPAQLVPGDAILWQGHIQLYVGPGERGALNVIEAVGRRFRTLRKAELLPGVFVDFSRALHVFRLLKAEG